MTLSEPNYVILGILLEEGRVLVVFLAIMTQRMAAGRSTGSLIHVKTALVLIGFDLACLGVEQITGVVFLYVLAP